MPTSFQIHCSLIFPYLYTYFLYIFILYFPYIIHYFILYTFYLVYLYCPCLWYTPSLSFSLVTISYFSPLSCSTPNWITPIVLKYLDRVIIQPSSLSFMYVFLSNSLRSSSFASSSNFIALCPVLILILSLFVSLLVL